MWSSLIISRFPIYPCANPKMCVSFQPLAHKPLHYHQYSFIFEPPFISPLCPHYKAYEWWAIIMCHMKTTMHHWENCKSTNMISMYIASTNAWWLSRTRVLITIGTSKSNLISHIHIESSSCGLSLWVYKTIFVHHCMIMFLRLCNLWIEHETIRYTSTYGRIN